MSKMKLIISSYIYDLIEEFTYEIRGSGCYHSQVGFKTPIEAERAGKNQMKVLILNNANKGLETLPTKNYRNVIYKWDYDEVDGEERYWHFNETLNCFKTYNEFKSYIDNLLDNSTD